MALVDLSHPIETGMTVFPGDPSVEVSRAADIEEDGYRVSAVTCGSHTGTHIDAPSHTEPAGAPIADYPIDAFVFDVRVIDVRGKTDREPIAPEAVPDGTDVDMLVFRTGWDEFWGTERYLDHPYLTPEVGRRCVEQGLSIGIDTLNPDPTPTANATTEEPRGFPVHHSVLGDGRFIIENLTHLAGVDAGTLYAFPLALADGDGAPTRAVVDTGDT